MFIQEGGIMKIPKFHDKNSLFVGVLAGIFLVFSGMFHGILVLGIFQTIIGWVLIIHCFDMVKYYKKHRIVRIDKTDTERIIHKDAKKDRSVV